MPKANTPIHRPWAIALAASLCIGTGAAGSALAQSPQDRLANAESGAMVVAHRGCHRAGVQHGLPSAPENSLLALDHCIAMGIDVMETDVRRTRDGYLIIMHDATVDRTTDGTGKVADMTLAQIRQLHLRDGMGGASAAVTAQQVPTLADMLSHGKGRILFNLDIQEAIYAEAIDESVRLGAAKDVILKTRAGSGSPPLAAIPPYDRVPFMPILSRVSGTPAEMVALAWQQLAGRRAPVAFGTPRLDSAALAALRNEARKAGVRLWTNTLGEGGDAEATRNPDRIWGPLLSVGFSMIQTDEPETLKSFIVRHHADERPSN